MPEPSGRRLAIPIFMPAWAGKLPGPFYLLRCCSAEAVKKALVTVQLWPRFIRAFYLQTGS